MTTSVFDKPATVTVAGTTVEFPTWDAALEFAKGFPFAEFGAAVIRRYDGQEGVGNTGPHDWVICGAAVLGTFSYQLHGYNLNAPPGGYGHEIHWRFDFAGKPEAKLDRRYDFSGADLTPAFLAFLERHEARTELR